MTKEVKILLIKIGTIVVIFLIFFFMLKSRDNRIEKLQNQFKEQQIQIDTMYDSNAAYIEAMKITMNSMDSLYELSKQTNESEIKNYWNMVSDSIINSNNTEFMSSWLTEFASRK